MTLEPVDDPNVQANNSETVAKIFESMPVMMIGLAGPNHRIVAINAAYRRALVRENVTGLPMIEAFPEIVAQQLSALCDRVYRSGNTYEGRGWRLQVEREPGSGQFTNLIIDFTITARRGADGTVVGLNGYSVDATERVLAQQRVQRQATEAIRRYERARDVVTALQRQLLPPGLPILPAVRLAASYLLADADESAGGDWFEAVPVSGGRVALVVGDVVGHGVTASVAMGQLRSVVQERLDATGDILSAVTAADRIAPRVPGARGATVCVVLLDPVDGALTYCSAGHPPPLIAASDGARFLPSSGQGPLGVGATHTVLLDRLGSDEVMLLYSDGILERPGRTLPESALELSQVVSDAVADRGFHGTVLPLVERVCAQTLELLVRETGHTDDITLLVAQRHTPAPPLELGGPASVSLISVLRAGLDTWLGSLDVDEGDRIAFTHAVVELATNAYEHGRSAAAGGTVTLTADLRDDGEAWVAITDNGQWRERARPGSDEPSGGHGFGLAMTAAFADRLDIEREDRGTRATFRRRLSRPVRLLTARQVVSHVIGAPAKPSHLLIILEQPQAPSSRIAVHGALDASNVEQLGAELDRLTLGGTHDLVVDLTAVTHIASAAVAEFYRADPHSDARHYPLRLFAPVGSAAHIVLSLVDLPHTTTDPHVTAADQPGPPSTAGPFTDPRTPDDHPC
ncbi:SpoIIE family protein phosphatase [Frankia sp. AgPm24]|uniref:SpoIIE family protein phosphatase n=1 Tax=Frankia sp. AgPm24 TaxID=631128 RepID=UPI00200DFB74|nr:SpoIIE family protein phosphatase [Frankia sp. AgPm24]MCK9923014.1 SpoIIE family protein phosphatase [Frankia sp. AgPm24]